MTNIIDFLKFKKKKEEGERLLLSLPRENTTFGDRQQRIQQSIERINKLMTELKTISSMRLPYE